MDITQDNVDMNQYNLSDIGFFVVVVESFVNILFLYHRVVMTAPNNDVKPFNKTFQFVKYIVYQPN
jgi:hypothetical protein